MTSEASLYHFLLCRIPQHQQKLSHCPWWGPPEVAPSSWMFSCPPPPHAQCKEAQNGDQVQVNHLKHSSLELTIGAVWMKWNLSLFFQAWIQQPFHILPQPWSRPTWRMEMSGWWQSKKPVPRNDPLEWDLCLWGILRTITTFIYHSLLETNLEFQNLWSPSNLQSHSFWG